MSRVSHRTSAEDVYTVPESAPETIVLGNPALVMNQQQIISHDDHEMHDYGHVIGGKI